MYGYNTIGAGASAIIAAGGENAEHVAKLKERHTLANKERKGSLGNNNKKRACTAFTSALIVIAYWTCVLE